MGKSMFLLVALAATLAAADKGPPTATAANDQLALQATLYVGKDAVREQIGSDLGGYFILVKLEATPKGGKPLAVGPDDFLMRSFKDGQKSGAFAPTQIAGRAALVVGSGAGGSVVSERRGPSWGGIGGPPRQMPVGGPTLGNTESNAPATATVVTGDKKKPDPLLDALKKKILPTTTTSQPVSGLLYFSLEGKHKAKDLVLQYDGPAGRMKIQFR
jgi:hypothetical protein